MNLDQIPTPENDDLRTLWRNAYGNDMFSAVEKILNSHEDLERRLTIARESLKKLDNWLMRDAQRKQIIEEALTLTAPKQ